MGYAPTPLIKINCMSCRILCKNMDYQLRIISFTQICGLNKE